MQATATNNSKKCWGKSENPSVKGAGQSPWTLWHGAPNALLRPCYHRIAGDKEVRLRSGCTFTTSHCETMPKPVWFTPCSWKKLQYVLVTRSTEKSVRSSITLTPQGAANDVVQPEISNPSSPGPQGRHSCPAGRSAVGRSTSLLEVFEVWRGSCCCHQAGNNSSQPTTAL